MFYAASPGMVTNPVYSGHDPTYVARFYRFEDEHGRYRADQTDRCRHDERRQRPAVARDRARKERPPLGKPVGVPRTCTQAARLGNPDDAAETRAARRARTDHLAERGSMPAFKRYLSTSAGQPMTDMVLDVPPLSHAAKERVGYPTQKPLALLDRLIKTASNEGDIVLDPFCGCATACVSAESLGRQWIGIDLSAVAATLVESRLRDQFGIFAEIHHRTDIPRRTDLGDLPNYRTHKHELFGKQEGHCGGCRMIFPFRNFEVDHVVPRAKGGSDHVDNLQLLCGACNRAKGTGTQAELITKLRERGQLAA